MIDNQISRPVVALKWLLVGALLAIQLCFLESCTGDHQTADNQKLEKKYFDLSGFVEGQMAQMVSQALPCKKIAGINGKFEEKSLVSNELEQELQVFVDADINKPAWSDKYSIDSLKEGGSVVEIKYLAMSPKMKTRELTVTYSPGNEVSQVYVRRVVKSVIADTYNDMFLWPGKGYEISTVQAVALSDTTRMEVKVVCE